MQILQHLIRLILAEIDPRPAGEQRQRAFIADVLLIFLPLRLCLAVGVADNHRLQVEDQDAVRIAPRLSCPAANIRHRLLQQHLRRRCDEDAFGMAGGELFAAAGRPRLIQHRRALRGWLAEVDPRHGKELSLMVNGMDFPRIAEDLPLSVAQYRPILPASLQQLIDHLQILIGIVIAGVMVGLGLLADIARPALQIGGDDIPAHPPFGQMIERRQTTSEGVRMLKRQRGGQTEAQMLRHQRHWGDQSQRIVDRNLRRLADRRIAAAVQHVIDPQHVGDKQPVELAALQQPRQIHPVLQIFILPGAIPGMRPQARRLMADAVHIESVKTNFTL